MRAFASLPLLAFGAVLSVTAAPARAADTTVTCNGPVLQVNTGLGDLTPARFTIRCSGGTNAGAITYFAYRISTNRFIPPLLAGAFNAFVIQHPGQPIKIASNLSDTSGAAWGCGFGNCRIIDYLAAN